MAGWKDRVGVGYFTPESPMTSPCNCYHLPIKKKAGGRGGSVVGEGDTVVWVLECRDEKIEWGVGYFTPESPMMSPRNHYRFPVETEGGERGGNVVGEEDAVVWLLGSRDEKIEWGGVFHPRISDDVPMQSLWPAH